MPERPPRLVYVHVMKTAGTSLWWSLRRHFRPDEIYPYPDPTRTGEDKIADYVGVERLRARVRARGGAVRLAVGHFPYRELASLFPDALHTTVLRDPVDRTVSILKQIRALHFDEGTSLEEVYEDPYWFATQVENHQTKVFALDEGRVPELFVPVDLGAGDLEVARERVAGLDLVGVTESLDRFWAALADRCGFDPEPPEPTRVSADAEPVPASFRRRIARDNALDVELYEHARSLAAAR